MTGSASHRAATQAKTPPCDYRWHRCLPTDQDPPKPKKTPSLCCGCQSPGTVEADRLSERLERVTDRTRAIIAVDLNGLPADYHELRTVADRHGRALIEAEVLADCDDRAAAAGRPPDRSARRLRQV
jgi:hypothetical protein